MPVCKQCGATFPNTLLIDGKVRVLNRRRYCLTCSPFGERGLAVRSRSRRWTDGQLETAVQASRTITAVLRTLGLSTSPGNYSTFYRHVERLNLDTSHFTGRAHGLSGSVGAVPLEDWLVQGSSISSSNLRPRLIKAGLLEERCALCGQGPVWRGKPLTLQLDHANGDPTDNRLENLRILCPNCHTQTSTYCSNNRSGRYTKTPNACVDCGVPIGRRSTRCRSCNRPGTPTKIEWPAALELAQEVSETSYVAVSRRLGVSDTAVKKYLRRKLGYAPRKHKARSASS